jgi:hypothetical protein
VDEGGKLIDSKMMEKLRVTSNWWLFTFGQD